MKRNMGNLDRLIRLVLGLVLTYFAVFQSDFFSSDVAYLAVIIFALINLVTSALSFCPLYALANIGHDKSDS